jgi:aryl-alcohol dehydrogenase-like predicted oxidoreductase
MEYRQLGQTDMQVSVVSFGASSLGSVFRQVTEAEGIAAVHAAIE